jgi:hypothetical protein
MYTATINNLKEFKMSYPFIIQGNNIVIVIENKTHTVSKTHITYAKVLDAIKRQDWPAVKATIEPAKVVLSYGRGYIKIEDGVLLWKGQEMHGYLVTKIVEMLEQGLPVEPLVNFMHNLMSNPSARAVKELYGFLEKGGMPITPDGHFLAYKKVRANYMDCHSGKMDNSVGKVVEMERNAVNDDKDVTCSHGLHFCSESYLNHFGGDRIMILKINPRDVVSIPSDYNDAKGRACRYEVIGELEGQVKLEPAKAFTAPVQTNGYGVNAATATVSPQAAWPFAAGAKPAPVVRTGPKYGVSDYTRGYTDGYNGFRNQYLNPDYRNGFYAGAEDKRNGGAMKYKFGTEPVTPKVAQDYDKNGNPLSMTKDAIRKRKARAAKAAKVTAQTQFRNAGWTRT